MMDVQAQKNFSAFRREHPAFQNMKFLSKFFGSFLLSWIWIRIHIPNIDPDPADQNLSG